MDVYSTVLWHLRAQDDLQALALSLSQKDTHSALTLCVVANGCSLRRDHEAAVKYLEAAVAKRPTYTYGHTLAGHEYLTLGDFAKAAESFRQALRYDSRHYNAIYGLGTVWFKQERLDMAEMLYAKAVALNPNSAVLFCYLGMVCEGGSGCERCGRHFFMHDSHNMLQNLHCRLAGGGKMEWSFYVGVRFLTRRCNVRSNVMTWRW